MGFRMTLETLKVLGAMLDKSDEQHYGLELSKQTGLASGSLYPILMRLEKNKWVTSAWEDVDAKEAGRKPRRYYKLTGYGIRRADEAFTEHGVRRTPIKVGGESA